MAVIIVEFNDANGKKQSTDLSKHGSFAFNADCMEFLRKCPDKAFDLCVCDPPYGAGFTEGGDCKGWFTKYHRDSSQTLNVERERERAKPTAV